MTPTPMAELMLVVLAGLTVAWLLSYLIHSTLAIGLAAVLTRLSSVTPAGRARVWRFALLAPVLTSAAHAGGFIHSGLTLDLARSGPQALIDWRAGLISLAPIALVPFVIFTGWLAGRLVMRRLFGVRRRASADLQSEVASLAVVVGCKVPRVTVSASAAVPAAIGFSEICVPASLLELATGDERRALLAHEMAHLVRRDPFWLACAGNLVRLTPYQPLNALALGELRAACEQAADDVAVTTTGDPSALARGLAKLATTLVLLSGSAAATGSPVVERVSRLLHGNSEGTSGPARPVHRVTAGVLAMLALAAMVWWAPGVAASPSGVADRLPWLTPSREEPNPRMLEIRRLSREWRSDWRRWGRGAR